MKSPSQVSIVNKMGGRNSLSKQGISIKQHDDILDRMNKSIPFRGASGLGATIASAQTVLEAKRALDSNQLTGK